MHSLLRTLLLCLLLGTMGISTSVIADDVLRFDRIPPNDVAPDFTLPDRLGNLHHLKDYRGKYLLVNFWSVDCSHCRQDMAGLEYAYRQLRKFNVAVLAINAGDSLERVNKMLQFSEFSYTILLDLELMMVDWGIPAIPTTYLLSPDGRRLYRAVGSRDWNSAAMIERLIAIVHATERPLL